MVVKFFSNKKGGSSKAIDYLLNHREQQGTAKVLQGDPNLTREIINNIKFKQKTTVGCLSFEEPNISEDLKHQLMKDFENHLLPGLEKEQYNILWVEHRDKGRLELNFVIPKIELTTQKSLNPYYHKADLPRVEKWQDLNNLKYEFSNPKDPSKARTLQTNSKEIGISKDYEQLDKLLHNLTLEGQIKNRDNLIELLQSNNIEVTRKGKDYISVKLPDSKKAKKFKGSIYDEQFTSIGAIEDISQRAEQRVEQYNNRDIQERIKSLSIELREYTEKKKQGTIKLFSSTTSKNNGGSERDKSLEEQNTNSIIIDNGNTNRNSHSNYIDEINEIGETTSDSIRKSTLERVGRNRKNTVEIFRGTTEATENLCRYYENKHREYSELFNEVSGYTQNIINKQHSRPRRISGIARDYKQSTERDIERVTETIESNKLDRGIRENIKGNIEEFARGLNKVLTESIHRLKTTIKQTVYKILNIKETNHTNHTKHTIHHRHR